jgi:sugar lactone lactonase YvrE
MKLFALAIIVMTSVGGLTAQQRDSGMVWPSLPERARIRHVQTISSMEPLQKKKGFFDKVLSFFTGDEQTPRWFVQPVGIAVTPNGRIYVTDPGANGVHIIDQKDRAYKFLSGTKTNNFLSPVGVALADDGTVYISDSKRGTVDVFNEDNNFKFELTKLLQRPTGLFVAQNRLYVADVGRHAVIVFDLKGNYITEFGRHGAGAGEFNFPVSVASHDTSLFVVDALNYRVQNFDPAGRFVATFGSQGNIAGRFASPKAIAVDSDGDLYVSDALMDNIQIFDSKGTLLLVVGHSGVGDGDFNSPNGIAIDHNNKMYVVETLNRRLQIFQYIR